MREIGGYIELDTYHLPMLHEGAIALNCGRNALAWLIRARGIKKLWIPKLICDSVTGVCEREGISYSFYSIGMNFRPAQEVTLGEGEWFYFINYYSQFDNNQIQKYVERYERIIVDNAQSYFQKPITGVDTIYTCRKYFGVPDGAFLYTDAKVLDVYPQDESFERMHFLLGRYERPAMEFYHEYVENNQMFSIEPIKKMSKLTWNLLHGINYQKIRQKRIQNYKLILESLGEYNLLSTKMGSFMYPLMVKDGATLRRRLLNKKIFIPILWPSVLTNTVPAETEYRMANSILPLPIDQRYGMEEIEFMIREIKNANDL